MHPFLFRRFWALVQPFGTALVAKELNALNLGHLIHESLQQPIYSLLGFLGNMSRKHLI